jgi:hypothetical protein
MPELGLFAKVEDLIERACDAQGRKIAFIRDDVAREEAEPDQEQLE